MLVLNGVLLLVIAEPGKGDGKCKLSETKPDLNELKKREKNIPNEDNSALANMIGYLHLPGKGYMPVVLSKLEIDHSVILISECATFIWNYRTRKQDSYILLDNLRVDLTIDVSDGRRLNTIYTIPTDNRPFPKDYRFSCKQQIKATVTDEKNPGIVLAEIVLASLEYQIGGNASNIARGVFDKRPETLSCGIFLD